MEALKAVVEVLREIKAPGMVIGGIAVIARGVPRQTVDVDATLWGAALGKATNVTFAGIEAPMATAEDLVIYKALAWRDRDRSDVERLIVLYGKEMNLQKVRDMMVQFAEILEEPQRVQEFDRLVQRATGSV